MLTFFSSKNPMRKKNYFFLMNTIILNVKIVEYNMKKKN